MKRMRKQLIRAFAVLLLAGCLYVGIGTTARAADLSQYFNTQAYADTYPDLKAAFGYDSNKLLDHYFVHGIDEGRVMSGRLNVRGYRAAYDDLDKAFGNDWRAYAEHYVSHGIAEGRSNGSGAQANTPVQEQTKQPAVDVNSVIRWNSNVSASYKNSVLRHWAMVPDSVKQDFGTQGWHVDVTAGEVHLAGYARVLAYTSFDQKTIFIGGRDDTAIVHEAGHYVDWRQGMCHKNIPDDVWQSERGSAIKLGGSAASINANKQEYFAECYWLYFKNNAGLKAACPQTYAFIQSHQL